MSRHSFAMSGKGERFDNFWVHKELEKFRDGGPPNAPKHGPHAPPDIDPPICRCGEKCLCMQSHEHFSYGQRYWGCREPTRLSLLVPAKKEVQVCLRFSILFFDNVYP